MEIVKEIITGLFAPIIKLIKVIDPDRIIKFFSRYPIYLYFITLVITGLVSYFCLFFE